MRFLCFLILALLLPLAAPAAPNPVASPPAAQQDHPAMLPTYTVQPHRAGGYALAGPLLPHALRFLDDAHAADYAHHMLRETAGRVLILDSRGRWQFTEHAQSEDTGRRISIEYRTGGN
jgi:hypothetical protein